MPELPEVEVARRNLARWFKGRKVVEAQAERSRTFRGGKPGDFEALRGKLLRAERKGKYLLLTFEHGRGLMAHLGMTGKFVRRPKLAPEPYSKARWVLDSGQVIHFRDPRLFGKMLPVPAEKLWEVSAVKALGPDLLEEPLDGPGLAAAVGKTRLPLKVALMDQGRVAGLGNIHAAEALFRAKLHPGLLPAQVSPAEWKRLSKAIHATLAFGLERTMAEEVHYVEEGGDVENPFLIYGHGKEPCPRCRTPIESFVQAGRTTYYCPSCQPKRRAR